MIYKKINNQFQRITRNMHSYNNQSYGSSYPQNSLQRSQSDWNTCSRSSSVSSANHENHVHGYPHLTHSQTTYDTSLANQNMAPSSNSLSNLQSTVDTEFQNFSLDYATRGRGRGRKKKNTTEGFVGNIEQQYSDQAQSTSDCRSYNLRPRRYTTSQPPEYNRTSYKASQRHQRANESMGDIINQNEHVIQPQEVPYIVTFPDQGNTENQTDYQNVIDPPAYQNEDKILKEFNDMYVAKKRKYNKKAPKQVTDLALVPVGNGHGESIELDTSKDLKAFIETNGGEGAMYRKYSAVELGVGDALIKMSDFEELNQIFQPETQRALDFSSTNQTANHLIPLAQPLDLRSQTPSQNYRSSILNGFENKTHNMFSHNNQVYPTFNVPAYLPTPAYHSNGCNPAFNNFYPYQLDIDSRTLTRPERVSCHRRKSERLMNNATSGGTAVACWGNSMTAQQSSKKGVPDKNEDQKKRQRTTYTREQIEVLEASFLTARYCSATERSNLAHMIGVEDKQVKIWFQNRRMRYRKANPHEPVIQRGGRGRKAQNIHKAAAPVNYHKSCAVEESILSTAAFPKTTSHPMLSPNQGIEYPSTKTPKLSSARITNSTHSTMVSFPFESRPCTTYPGYYSTVGGPAFPTSSVQENPFTTTASNINNTSKALPQNTYMPASSWNNCLPSLLSEGTSQYPSNCIATNTVTASSESPAIYAPKNFYQTTCSSSHLYPLSLTQQVTPHYSATLDTYNPRSNVPASSFASSTTPASHNFYHSLVPSVQGTLTSSSENSTLYSVKNNFQTSSSASPVSPMITSQPGTPQYSSTFDTYNSRRSVVASPLVPVLPSQNNYQSSLSSVEDTVKTTPENAMMHSDKSAYQATCSASHLSAMLAPQPELPQYSTPFEAYNPATSISGSARGSVTMPASQNIYPSLESAEQDAIKTSSENSHNFSTKSVYQITASPSHASLMPSLQETSRHSDSASSVCAGSVTSRSPPQLVINEDYSEKSSEDFEKNEIKDNRNQLVGFENQSTSMDCKPTRRNHLKNETLNSAENVYSEIPVLSPCISVSSVKTDTEIDSKPPTSSTKVTVDLNAYQDTGSVNTELQSLQRMIDQFGSPKKSSSQTVPSKTGDRSDQNPVSHSENVNSLDCDTKNFDKLIHETNSTTQLSNQNSKEVFTSEIARIQSSHSTDDEPSKYSYYLNEPNKASNLSTNGYATTSSYTNFMKWNNSPSKICTRSHSSATNSRDSISWQNLHSTFGSSFNPNRRVSNSSVIKPRAVHANALKLNGTPSTFSAINLSDILDGRDLPNGKVIKTEPLDEYSTEIDNNSFLLNCMTSTTNSSAQSQSATINVSSNSSAQFTTTPSSNSYSDSYVSRPINTPSLPQGYNHISPTVTGSFYAVRSESNGSNSNSSSCFKLLHT